MFYDTQMAFGSFFKKIITGAKNLVGKAAPVVRAVAGTVNKFAPVVSKVARKFGPIGETIGSVVDTAGNVAGKVSSWMDKNQSAIEAFSGSWSGVSASRFNGPILEDDY